MGNHWFHCKLVFPVLGFHTNDIIQQITLCLISFIQPDVFEMHPRGCMPVCCCGCWMLFFCVILPQLLLTFACWHVLEWFFMGHMLHACLLNIYLRLDFEGSYSESIFNFRRTTRLFPKVATPFYIPTRNIRRFQFLHILTRTWNCFPFWFSLS